MCSTPSPTIGGISRSPRSGRCSRRIATTVLFIWSIFTPWGVVYGALPVFVAMVGWFWPKVPTKAGRSRGRSRVARCRGRTNRRPPEARYERAARLLDVGGLPPGAFGSRSLTWWGTLGMVVIESTVFALAIGSYFYLHTRCPAWPPDGVAPPDLRWGTLNTLVLLASLIPNELAKRAGEHIDLRGVRLWMVVCLVFGIGFNIVRVLEFRHLNVRWDHDAYGSIVWLLLGLHTTHIVTDFLDTAVLTVLMFVGPIEEQRFVDVEENAVYWYFVVLAWLPIYGVIYWAPRLI